MALKPRLPRLAVLIDADNAPARIADDLFEEIAKLGQASVRRIYGDVSAPNFKGWRDVLTRHAIDPRQQFAYTTGKNASDITMVIEAMDLLHTDRFEGFCLVSSDSDFTRLASRIREQGTDVFGFGEQKTPESFRQACSRFIYTENLVPAAADEAAGTKVALKPLAQATVTIRNVVIELAGEEGWVPLSMVGSLLNNRHPDFDSRTYGYRQLSGLVGATSAFDIELRESGGHVIRIKTAQRPKKPS